MIGLKYEDVINKIKDKSNLSQQDIDDKIKKKLDQLSGLISREGAAHIIANELGVKIFDSVVDARRYKVKDLNPLQKYVELLGKVVKLYEVRTFQREERTARVCSMLIGDETGSCRLVLWDEKLIDLVANNKIKDNDILLVKNAYVKENNGYKEIHLGSNGELQINPEGETIAEVAQAQKPAVTKKKINELQENDFAEVFGFIVQIFDPAFYDACPECNKKLEKNDTLYTCKEHGAVEPNQAMILNFIIDDSTENIRVVCFRETAEQVMGLSAKEIFALRETPEKMQELKDNLSAKPLLVTGRVRKNVMFDRIELTANEVKEADPTKLSVQSTQ